MKTRPVRMKHLLPLAGLVVAAMVAVPGASSASTSSGHEGCERAFDAAQRLDMESFRDYDAETFRAGHIDEAVTVFASGATRFGIDAIMQALAPHFANREALWSWTELFRHVEGCKTGYILYDTVYEIPSVGFSQHALVGVTYTHQSGKWLAVADQGTLLPAGR